MTDGTAQSIRGRPRAESRQLCAAYAAYVHRLERRGVSGPRGGDPRSPALHLEGDLRSLRPARLRAGEARHRRRRHRRRDAPQHPRDVRMPFRRPDGRGGAQHPQHPARRRRDRVHAEPRGGEGAHHGSRVLRHDRGRAREGRPEADRDRRRRSRVRRARRTARAHRLRGIPRRGRPGVRLAAARRRVAGDLAQLHLGHDGQPEGGGLLAPRRLPERRRQPAHLEHAAAGRLSLDAADVPLQRLVLPVEHGGQRRHQRLPAESRAGPDLQADPGAPGHALLRRADRAQRADQRGSEAARGHQPQGVGVRRRCRSRRRR